MRRKPDPGKVRRTGKGARRPKPPLGGYWPNARQGYWTIALPPAIRLHLDVSGQTPLYWHSARSGEAVLSTTATRAGGRPALSELSRQVATLEAENRRLRAREESRDRSMYAEGYALGVIQTRERLIKPHGPSAERARRRRVRHEVVLLGGERPSSPSSPSDPVEGGGAGAGGNAQASP